MTAKIIDFAQKKKERLLKLEQELINTDVLSLSEQQIEDFIVALQKLTQSPEYSSYYSIDDEEIE